MSRKTRTRPAHVWVVERKRFGCDSWFPVMWALNRDQGRAGIDHYSGLNPSAQFRLRKYVREDPS